MKKALIAAIVLVGGLVAYNYATTGELSVIPSFSLSEEERQIQDLEDEFQAARKEYAQAHRAASVSGIDTTGDVRAARQTVARISKELESLRKRLSEDRARRRAESLASMVREFARELG